MSQLSTSGRSLGEFALALLVGPVGAGGNLAGMGGDQERTRPRKSLTIKREGASSGSAWHPMRSESGDWQERVSLA